MRIYSPTMVGTLLAAAALSAMATPTAAPAFAAQSAQRADGISIDAEVATLYKQITAAYHGLNTYQHTAIYTRRRVSSRGEDKQTTTYHLAMERPNRFLFRSDDPNADAAVSDGTTFINYRNGQGVPEYTQHPAPATFKGFNFVDDVVFEPQGTCLVALALQGDVLADKDVTSLLARAKMGDKVQENGKTYETAVITDPRATMTLFVDADTHHLSKIVQKSIGIDASVTEEFRDIQIDRPIDSSVFKYTPPAAAKLVTKFTDSQAEEMAKMRAISAKYEGKPAPDFTVLDSAGKPIKLSAYKGKVVVVDFWASWCTSCHFVMPTIQEIHDKFKDNNVVVMAVDSWDEKDDCRDFLKANPKYTMPVLRDPLGARDQENSIAQKLYGTPALPATLIIDRKGIVNTYVIGIHDRDFYFNALKKLGVRIGK